MTKTELNDLIANGENSGVEFKGDVIDGHELAKELVAFANGWGGRVLLGVDDDGSIRGLAKRSPPTQSEMHDAGPRAYQWLYQWVMQVCHDKIHPEIVPVLMIT